MQTFAEWFEGTYQQRDEGRSAAVLRLSQESRVSMPAIWRGLRGSVLAGPTVSKLIGVAGDGAFDALAVIRAPHVPPQERGKHLRVKRATSDDSPDPASTNDATAAESPDARETAAA